MATTIWLTDRRQNLINKIVQSGVRLDLEGLKTSEVIDVALQEWAREQFRLIVVQSHNATQKTSLRRSEDANYQTLYSVETRDSYQVTLPLLVEILSESSFNAFLTLQTERGWIA